jgi:hypothetical protein
MSSLIRRATLELLDNQTKMKCPFAKCAELADQKTFLLNDNSISFFSSHPTYDHTDDDA